MKTWKCFKNYVGISSLNESINQLWLCVEQPRRHRACKNHIEWTIYNQIMYRLISTKIKYTNSCLVFTTFAVSYIWQDCMWLKVCIMYKFHKNTMNYNLNSNWLTTKAYLSLYLATKKQIPRVQRKVFRWRRLCLTFVTPKMQELTRSTWDNAVQSYHCTVVFALHNVLCPLVSLKFSVYRFLCMEKRHVLSDAWLPQ